MRRFVVLVLLVAMVPAASALGDDGDTTPPETVIDSGPAEGSTIANPSPTFGFSADQAGATFACAVDDEEFASCTSFHTLARLAYGSHTFAVRATDSAGNTDPTPALRSFSVDNAPPDGVITKAPPKRLKTPKKRVKVAFEFVSSESRSQFACSLDGGASIDCRAPATYTVRKGTHRFELFVRDRTGTPDASPARYEFEVERRRR